MDKPAALAVVSTDRDGSLVQVAGEIDLQTVGVLADALASLFGPVVVDLAAVEFLGAVGARVLVAHQERLQASGGSLSLRDPSPPARRVLEICGMLPTVERETALSAP